MIDGRRVRSPESSGLLRQARPLVMGIGSAEFSANELRNQTQVETE